MATPTDTTFGSSFDPALFRSAIISTMEMGLPTDTSERATFRWTTARTWSRQDASGKPFNWTAPPATEVVHPDVRIPVAVEFAQNARNSQETAVGAFDTPRAIITVLDTHYPSVATADQVILGKNTYILEYWAPPIGLFSVTIYTAYCVARDES